MSVKHFLPHRGKSSSQEKGEEEAQRKSSRKRRSSTGSGAAWRPERRRRYSPGEREPRGTARRKGLEGDGGRQGWGHRRSPPGFSSSTSYSGEAHRPSGLAFRVKPASEERPPIVCTNC